MADEIELVSLEYLLGGSKISLENAMLNRLADERNRRKELLELFEKWAERRAQAMLLRWFLEHGDELMGSLTRSATVTEIKRFPAGEKPSPISISDFRETLRTLVNSA